MTTDRDRLAAVRRVAEWWLAEAKSLRRASAAAWANQQGAIDPLKLIERANRASGAAIEILSILGAECRGCRDSRYSCICAHPIATPAVEAKYERARGTLSLLAPRSQDENQLGACMLVAVKGFEPCCPMHGLEDPDYPAPPPAPERHAFEPFGWADETGTPSKRCQRDGCGQPASAEVHQDQSQATPEPIPSRSPK